VGWLGWDIERGVADHSDGRPDSAAQCSAMAVVVHQVVGARASVCAHAYACVRLVKMGVEASRPAKGKLDEGQIEKERMDGLVV